MLDALKNTHAALSNTPLKIFKKNLQKYQIFVKSRDF